MKTLFFLIRNTKSRRVTSCLLLVAFFFGCQQKGFKEPKVSLEEYFIEDGFELQVATSEPFIEAPVTMSFDNKGRMWVVEMKGYMQNLEGTGDDKPNGRITILEDLDNDGVTDHSKVFLDSLVLPRAIAHVYGGLLYAESPNLWFVDIKDDKPQNRILVDSLYADGGNVEHQPNGLMMHLDNWIYNAKSNFRYQRKNGKWLKESTTFRGQWGITKDNFGRLYYNTNSTQLMGDYVLPNTVIKNQYYKPREGVSKKLTKNQRVYPMHPTAVNRGYGKGTLDKDSLLVNVTAACGPLVYTGDKFPGSYMENTFISVPEANVVKRKVLNFATDSINAKQAISNKEFIASTDEGFRPVNLFNGPDGNLYIVDMHRGIIQDKAFLTPYLHDLLAEKELDTIIGMGRVLRVVHNSNNALNKSIDLDDVDINELVDLLASPNGWHRDRAQQLLIYRSEEKVVPLLLELLQEGNSVTKIHVLHTLDGLKALNFESLVRFITSNDNSNSLSHAVVLIEQFADLNRVDVMENLVKELIGRNDEQIDLYLMNSLGKWLTISKQKFFPLLLNISERHRGNLFYQESLISGLSGVEQEFKEFVSKNKITEEKTVLDKILTKTISNKKKNKKNFIYTKKGVGTDTRTAGYNIFRNLCATCHGIDGGGIENLAPPLKNSEYVTQSSKRLALVILHGLSGPIHVNKKLYNLSATMPGLANNSEFTDKDILDIINYLNHAFPGDSKSSISLKKIKELREKKPKDGGVFTEKELLGIEF